ncbi:MAG TPA: hypothetical protein VMV37_03600, partial [Gammaproteobacteria bacterium]|nr:hypothetical protein [Gammaproteobacteria bacterium]
MRITHAFVLSALVVAFWAPRALEAQAKPSCDRTCLKDVMSKYLDSLVAHDPKKAPLASNVRFTEDAKELKVGEGFWKTATKLRPFRTDFLDPQTGTAAVHAVIEEDGKPILFSGRLKVVDKKITEIETIVVHNQAEGALFAPDALAAPSPAMVTPPRKDLLTPRQQMIDVALRYPAGLKVGSFEKSDAPFAKDAYRLENGVKMAGPGCTFQPPSCE